ncbi:M15 family metallopeptidase [Salegentibacter chungangensis]|uniref:D-alanyl-D-alanine dipeptidase n=1 Tax=Salegentibacter chungangensis TaxID=1335724 RepID=A0ABW3NQQ6_9FLAO
MKFLFSLCFLLLSLSPLKAQNSPLPEGFIHVKEAVPGVAYEIRYAGDHNFMGRPVTGYKKAEAILSEPAAQALCLVQKDLKKKGYGLKIFDAYRPQQAVDHFVSWASKPGDTLAKAEFYPDVAKNRLFQLGYIASRSGHSRGSTVDLTIIDLETGREIDMGSPYDFFGDISHHNTSKIGKKQKGNRELLKNAMMKQGFRPYSEEWWHYTLRNEPYPDTYFNFEVK